MESRSLTDAEKRTVQNLQHGLEKATRLSEKMGRELKEFQELCSHPALPKRQLGEEYVDTCPDCGHVNYCYKV